MMRDIKFIATEAPIPALAEITENHVSNETTVILPPYADRLCLCVSVAIIKYKPPNIN